MEHPVEPEAEPPVIWSDDEEDAADDQQANSVSGPEPRTFKQAMHGPWSDRWRDAALLEYNTLVEILMAHGRLLIFLRTKGYWVWLDIQGKAQSGWLH